MESESAQGRNGAFVELAVLVGESGNIVVMFFSMGGEIGGLFRAAVMGVLGLQVVMTVRGRGRVTPTEGEEPAGAWTTGLNPEGAGWNTVVGMLGAREKMGVVGTGNATLKRGSVSPTAPPPVWKLAGGERLSGDALGGVMGAYGMETAGIFTTEIGAWRGGAFGMETCELAAMAALIDSSF